MNPSVPLHWRNPALGLIALAGAAALGGCAQAPVSQQQRQAHGKEYFPSSIYGRASERVVADGEPVPKGGGQYLVGHAYSVAGHTYVPSERKFAAVGLASWYGDAFHGRRTANGEVYDKNAVTAAHPTMPLPSYARVTNLRNRRSIIVRVNDRGPYHGGRVMDLSATAADALSYRHIGTARVKVEYIGRASLAGSDDTKLLATLRVDGSPAQLDDFAYSPTRLAEQRENLTPANSVERVALALQQTESPRQEIAAPIDAALAPKPDPKPVAKTAPVPPQRVAMADTDDTSVRSDAAPLPNHAPLPPQRPFNLGVSAPVSVARR
jgi:rare lipoprotein A